MSDAFAGIRIRPRKNLTVAGNGPVKMRKAAQIKFDPQRLKPAAHILDRTFLASIRAEVQKRHEVAKISPGFDMIDRKVIERAAPLMQTLDALQLNILMCVERRIHNSQVIIELGTCESTIQAVCTRIYRALAMTKVPGKLKRLTMAEAWREYVLKNTAR